MQGATRHFPCHVFWSTDLGGLGYAVWGRPTANQHEQEAVLRMLEAQRKEREEYARLVQEHKWQEECGVEPSPSRGCRLRPLRLETPESWRASF